MIKKHKKINKKMRNSKDIVIGLNGNGEIASSFDGTLGGFVFTLENLKKLDDEVAVPNSFLVSGATFELSKKISEPFHKNGEKCDSIRSLQLARKIAHSLMEG